MFAISHINPVQLFLLSVRELLKLENSLTFSMALCRKRKEEKKRRGGHAYCAGYIRNLDILSTISSFISSILNLILDLIPQIELKGLAQWGSALVKCLLRWFWWFLCQSSISLSLPIKAAAWDLWVLYSAYAVGHLAPDFNYLAITQKESR